MVLSIKIMAIFPSSGFFTSFFWYEVPTFEGNRFLIKIISKGKNHLIKISIDYNSGSELIKKVRVNV